jgi:hypothetical protein
MNPSSKSTELEEKLDGITRNVMDCKKATPTPREERGKERI